MSLYREATRALELLWHAARIDPALKNAVDVVSKEREQLLEWARDSFEECSNCIRCLTCNGIGELCEFHEDYEQDGCDCEVVE